MNDVRKVNFRKIEELRLDSGMNRKEFCRKARISMVTYQRLPETDRLRDDVLIRMAKGLNVRPTELIYWEEKASVSS